MCFGSDILIETLHFFRAVCRPHPVIVLSRRRFLHFCRSIARWPFLRARSLVIDSDLFYIPPMLNGPHPRGYVQPPVAPRSCGGYCTWKDIRRDAIKQTTDSDPLFFMDQQTGTSSSHSLQRGQQLAKEAKVEDSQSVSEI